MISHKSADKNSPSLKFFGAIDNEVTGSMHVYKTIINGQPFRVGMDAGVEQGMGVSPLENKSTGINKKSLPDVLIMSHSHLDHCGSLPLMAKEGFNGKVLGTEETLEGIKIALIDSLVVMQKRTDNAYSVNISKLKTTLREYRHFTQKYGADIDSGKYLYLPSIVDEMEHFIGKNTKNGARGYGHRNKKGNKFNEKNQIITGDDTLDFKDLFDKYTYELTKYGITSPADIDNMKIDNNYLPFSKEDIDNIVARFCPVELEKEIILNEAADNAITTVLVNAGHILGSAQIILKDKKQGNLLFTGDLGRIREPLHLKPPVLVGNTYGKIHTMISESTYGGKELHPPRLAEWQELVNVIKNTKGSKVISAFANNRLQDIANQLAFTIISGDVGNAEAFASSIVCDGYTSEKFTFLFNKYAKEDYKYLNENIITRAKGKPNEKVDRYLNSSSSKDPILSSSGMLNGGAIENYLHPITSSPDNLLVLTGYQVGGTRGEQIFRTNKYKLNGQTHEVKCKVFKCKSFSSHADNDELIQVIASAKPDKTFLVHGEMSSKLSLKQSILEQKLTNEVVIPTAKGKKHYPAGRK